MRQCACALEWCLEVNLLKIKIPITTITRIPSSELIPCYFLWYNYQIKLHLFQIMLSDVECPSVYELLFLDNK